MTAYRKKPVVIEAWKIEHDTEQPELVKAEFRAETLDWCPSGEGLWINTLEGCMVGSEGDMLIRGVKGEHYPCKPDIFALTYEPATPPAHPVLAPVVREPLTATPTQFIAAHTYLRGCEIDMSGAELDNLLRIFGIQATTGEQSHE